MKNRTISDQNNDQNIQIEADHARIGMDVASLKRAITDQLFFQLGKKIEHATLNDMYLAVSFSVRDRLIKAGLRTLDMLLKDPNTRVISYFSAEHLTGPQLGANLIDLSIYGEMEQAVSELGFSLDKIITQEQEPGLGNGGLGRLASCYLDSMASLEIPAIGYGIRYEFGIFDQEIRDGWQVEITDKWLRNGNPWEYHRHVIT